jgi:phosphatidylglycerophosphatase A
VTFAEAVLSFGGFGFSPKAPGTAGTAGAALGAGALLAYAPDAVHSWTLTCVSVVVLASALTVLLTPAVEASRGKDPGVIVMDEVAGYFATVALVPRPGATHLVLAFFVFRLFDIVKPWPGRALERLPSGWGVLLDDVAAGVYGAAVVWGLDRYVAAA